MKALYRKYRPVRLEDVVGQKQVTQPLGSALAAGRIGHAYLFTGPRGTGKTSVARILAHIVNGFSYEVEDNYVDIVEIDGASNRGIDDIRELREKVAIAPSAGKYKVYIIDEVHMLTKEAFNALLKTLEEPPEHVIFVMATTDAYKVPVTITSRAQVFEFRLVGIETMVTHLQRIAEAEGIAIEPEALMVIAERGGGSFRDSLSLLDQLSSLSDEKITREMIEKVMGLPSVVKITTLLDACSTPDSVVKITTVLKEIMASGVKAETVAEELIRRIVSEPKPEWMELLERLPEVKAPFAEARLMAALAYKQTRKGLTRDGSLTPVFTGFAPSSSVATSGSPREPLSRLPQNTVAGASAGYDRGMRGAAPVTTGGGNPVPRDSILRQPYDWQGFVERVRAMNDAICSQLVRASYVFDGTTLTIYPEKRIAGMILGKEANLRILTNAGGGVKITIGEPGVKVENGEKDPLISKISGIMGGEVIEDGGGNPFK